MTVIGNCSHCTSAIELGDLRCAVCGCLAPISADARPAVQATVMRCDDCGAAVAYDIHIQAPTCAFCGSVMHVEAIDDPLEQTQAFLPFQLSTEHAREALRQWLGSLGFFRPSDLTAEAQLDSMRPLWWTAWVFNVDALVTWTADSNAGANNAEWAPHTGQLDLTFNNILISASRGLSDDEVADITPFYSLETAVASLPPVPGATIEQFDVQRSLARDRINRTIDGLARHQIKSVIPGRRHRNIHIEPVLRGLTTTRFALPAYVMAYRYRGSLYRAVLSGQHASGITGTAPISVWKVLGVALAVIAAIALIGLALTQS